MKSNLVKKQIDFFEKNRFGAMALMLTFQSCYGSIAAMLSLQTENVITLSICSVVTMASNAAFIAGAPSKWCVNIFNLSVLSNSIIIIYGMLK